MPDGRYLGVFRSRWVDLKDMALDIIDCIHHVHCQDACEHNKVLSGTTDFLCKQVTTSFLRNTLIHVFSGVRLASL
jgi:hypothetical protein